MEKHIEGAKQLIEQQVTHNKISSFGARFAEHQKVYSWTNENIAAYLDTENFENKNSALTVLASGDHTFNLLFNGVNNIDTFDSNALTEFYALGFKRAMILKYDYHTFLDLMGKLLHENTSIIEINDIIASLFPYMEKEHKIFWVSIIEYNYKLQKEHNTNLNLFLMLTLANNNIESIFHNNYLFNEENYNKLKSKLTQANITFKCANAVNLASDFSGEYDFILLSNILDYFNHVWGYQWKYEDLKSYLNNLESICNNDSIIFIKYIYYYGTKMNKKRYIFTSFGVTASDLTDEEIILFPSLPGSSISDGMVLKRVKSCEK